jgi:hypothetical protein
MSKFVKDKMTPEQRHAENTLEWRSYMLLGIAFLAPFAGLWLMRWILQSVGAADGGPYITYFHGTLFVLFGGVRPINHLAALVAGQTRELHGKVHHPPLKDEVEEDLELKVERMEMLLSMLTEKLREQESSKMEDTTLKRQGMLEVQDNFEKTAARLEDGARRREKKAEMALEMMERRLEGLEKQYEGLLSVTLKEREAVKQAEPTLRGLILKWLDWIEAFFRMGQRRAASRSPNGYYSPTSSRRLATNGNGNGRGSTSGTAISLLLRRRSHEGAGPINLDTVVEEGPEEADPAQGGDHEMIDLLGVADGNTPELTMPAHGIRKRTKVGGLDNLSGSTANGAAGSNSGGQFIRVPAEGSNRHGKKAGGHSRSGGATVDGVFLYLFTLTSVAYDPAWICSSG